MGFIAMFLPPVGEYVWDFFPSTQQANQRYIYIPAPSKGCQMVPKGFKSLVFKFQIYVSRIHTLTNVCTSFVLWHHAGYIRLDMYFHHK